MRERLIELAKNNGWKIAIKLRVSKNGKTWWRAQIGAPPYRYLSPRYTGPRPDPDHPYRPIVSSGVSPEEAIDNLAIKFFDLTLEIPSLQESESEH